MPAWPYRIRVSVVSMVVGGLFAPAVSAVVFNVDSYLDGIDDDLVDIACHTVADTCTLRAAVMQANMMPGDSTIVLPAGTYSLTRLPVSPFGADNGDLNLTSPSGGNPTITLSGAGAATTIIDANFLDRVLRVHENRTANISGVTLRNGLASNESGGGVKNEGALTVSYCTLSGNEALYAGGIITLSSGALTISHSKLSGNTAVLSGGGIYSSGTLTISHSTVSDNSSFDGGGLYFDAVASANLSQSTISSNGAGFGGGVYVANGTLYLANSTISENRASHHGGGVFNEGTIWTYNATIAFNHADSDDDGGGNGGGVFNDTGANFLPRNSVMAGNLVSHSFYVDCFGTVGTFGHDWFGTYDFCTPVAQTGTAVSSLIGSLVELGPLQFNGGSTRTHALLVGSTMIDSGFACIGLGDPPLDQRGGARGPALPEQLCDPGAFEYDALPAGLLFADGFELGNLWAWR